MKPIQLLELFSHFLVAPALLATLTLLIILYFRYKKIRKSLAHRGIFPIIEPSGIDRSFYKYTAIGSGWFSFFLTVFVSVGKIAHFLPETEEVYILISIVYVVSLATTVGSSYLHFKNEMDEMKEDLRVLAKRADIDMILKFDVVRERPRLVAVKKAAAEVFGHLHMLQAQIALMAEEGSVTLFKDWSIISAFVRQLINTISEMEVNCVWMGTSLVTHPDGWVAQNDVVYRFDEAIRHATFRNIIQRVYRLYFLEPGVHHRATVEGLQDTIQKSYELSEEKEAPRDANNILENTLDFRIACPKHKYDYQDVHDVSFVFTSNDIMSNDLPDPTWSQEELAARGWRLALALEWVVRNNFLVDSLHIHSEESGWFGEHYRKMRDLWTNNDITVRVPLVRRAQAGEIGEPNPANQANGMLPA